ncbi:MAG TPA: hypothetical protein VF221_15880 [Chloroflexota bacterium]
MPGRTLTTLAIVLLMADLFTRLPVAAHSQTAPFARFAGSWSTHGGVLQIGPRGRGHYQMRTYVNCTATILTDCDRFKGQIIYDGGFATFTLTRVAGNTAFGKITNSSTSWEINTPLSFRLTTKDALVGGGASDLVNGRRFCGPRAPVGFCGA